MICTDRLFLHDFSINDLDKLHRLNSDPKVMRFMDKPESMDETRYSLEKILTYNQTNPGLGFAVCFEQETNKFVGWFCLSHLDKTNKIEISYRLLPSSWNKGYAVEMCSTLLNYGFAVLNLNKIVGIAHPQNIGLKRVWKKLGLEFIDFANYYDTTVAYYESIQHVIE